MHRHRLGRYFIGTWKDAVYWFFLIRIKVILNKFIKVIGNLLTSLLTELAA